MPAGRPKKTVENTFPENWKDLVIGWSIEGWSEAEIRVELCKEGGKFSERLWFKLKDREEEFMQTLQMCKQLRQAWWEKQARESLKAPAFQTGLWYACMKNMFGYRDKHEEKTEENIKDEEIEILGVPKNGVGKDRFAKFLN